MCERKTKEGKRSRQLVNQEKEDRERTTNLVHIWIEDGSEYIIDTKIIEARKTRSREIASKEELAGKDERPWREESKNYGKDEMISIGLKNMEELD